MSLKRAIRNARRATNYGLGETSVMQQKLRDTVKTYELEPDSERVYRNDDRKDEHGNDEA